MTLRTQLPLVCMPCRPAFARSAITSGRSDELDPVELEILPRGEMAVVAVVAPRDMRERAQLIRRQRAVGNGDAQHIGMKLQIDAVHQPQRLELVLGQFARQPARDLVAEFGDALVDQRAVKIVVDDTWRFSEFRT